MELPWDMDVDERELVGIANGALRDAGFSLHEPPNYKKLVRELFGATCLRRGEGLVRQRASSCLVHGEFRIYLTKAATRFDGYHEAGHGILRKVGYRGHHEERFATIIGTNLMMPGPAVRAVAHLPLPEKAERFLTSETCFGLREAEELELPRVIVAPTHIHVRGPENFVWPAETTLRTWTKKPLPGIVKTRLQDAPKRFMLDAPDAIYAA